MKYAKKVIALVLTAVMIGTAVPQSVFAEASEQTADMEAETPEIFESEEKPEAEEESEVEEEPEAEEESEVEEEPEAEEEPKIEEEPEVLEKPDAGSDTEEWLEPESSEADEEETDEEETDAVMEFQMDDREDLEAESADSYTVSTDDELKAALESIKNGDKDDVEIVLNSNVKAPTENYVATFGVDGKHICVRSTAENCFTLKMYNVGILAGACTFENVKIEGNKLYCSGYKTIFTEECVMALSQTLYGGGCKKDVDSTYVVLNASGFINKGATNGTHNVVGGSYQGSVRGDSYLEITGNIEFHGGNHITPGCVMGDGTSGDGSNSPDVFVGGKATLI